MFNSSIGRESNTKELSSRPFMVGDLDPSRTFVHVLTESTVNVLLETLDTISDFVSYLDKKESLIRSKISIFVPGEEDLLAFYLMQINDKGQHDFNVSGEYSVIMLEESFWNDFCNRPERIEQLRQNRISYIWDNLIERFAHHALNATQYYTNCRELSNTEIGLRFMAREPRTVRRLIAKYLIDLYTNTPEGTKRTKYLMPLSDIGPFYVFLSLPQPDCISYEQYREARYSLLESCCMVVKYKFPYALDIVGIASDPVRPNRGSSEDMIYLDAREWSDELDNEAAQLQKEFDILRSANFCYGYEKEYPEPIVNDIILDKQIPKVGRNQHCPCGSGKKYKYCHGR